MGKNGRAGLKVSESGKASVFPGRLASRWIHPNTPQSHTVLIQRLLHERPTVPQRSHAGLQAVVVVVDLLPLCECANQTTKPSIQSPHSKWARTTSDNTRTGTTPSSPPHASAFAPQPRAHLQAHDVGLPAPNLRHNPLPAQGPVGGGARGGDARVVARGGKGVGHNVPLLGFGGA